MKILLEIICKMFSIGNDNLNIKNVVMDSRKVEKDSLFFAINNGNSYVEKALSDGASLVIADNYEKENPRVIKVADSITTMQEIANLYRKKLGIKVIGITGSNGKTTTKDLIYTLLKERFKCIKTLGNYNNHIGLPFTILQCKEKDEIAVLEMGMSSFGEIDKLCQIASLDIGVITNIGDSHLEFLKTRENVFKAKTEMVKYLTKDNLVVFGDDPYLKKLSAIKVGFEEGNDYIIENIVENDEGSSFEIGSVKYSLNINGRHNIINSAMAIVIGKRYFNLTDLEIERGLNNIELTGMRFEKIVIEDDIYINDAYNASPISMKVALETFNGIYKDRYKIAVLGDMLELGEKELEFHKNVILEALKTDAQKIYLYGPRMKTVVLGGDFQERVVHFEDKEKIKAKIKSIPHKKAILLKGSRGMKMEEII